MTDSAPAGFYYRALYFQFCKWLKRFEFSGWGVMDPFRYIRSYATGLAFVSVDDFRVHLSTVHSVVDTSSCKHGTVRGGGLFGYLRL
jgi:hypothetical protein